MTCHSFHHSPQVLPNPPTARERFDSLLAPLRRLSSLPKEILGKKRRLRHLPWSHYPPMTSPDLILSNPSKALDQTKCALFNKLPTEIRMMIWEEMFAGFVLVPRLRVNYLGGWEPNDWEPWWQIRGLFHWNGWRDGGEEVQVLGSSYEPAIAAEWRHWEGRHCGIFRTCRAVYVETKTMFYERNLFYIQRGLEPVELKMTFRPNWLASIQRLYVCSNFDDDAAATAGEVLKQMPALRELVIAQTPFLNHGDRWSQPTPYGPPDPFILFPPELPPACKVHLIGKVRPEQAELDKHKQCEFHVVPDPQEFGKVQATLVPRNPLARSRIQAGLVCIGQDASDRSWARFSTSSTSSVANVRHRAASREMLYFFREHIAYLHGE